MRRHWMSALFVAAGCGSSAGEEPFALTTLTDTNPDPDIVEVELVAGLGTMEYLPGKPAEIWAYRDGAMSGSKASVPGPMLDVLQGNRVIVHFRNELPEETTVHWHGIRVPNLSDGTSASQVPVPPGGTYDYEFVAADAGLYWYHPHMHGDVQVEKGLYAPARVRGDTTPAVVNDRVFVLDDVKLEASGELSDTTDALDLMLGRQGNVLLVNGRAGGKLPVTRGTRERWRFVNSANGRYFNLSLPGFEFLVIGWDGGLLPEPYTTATLLIAPGERYDVLVDFVGAEGQTVPLETLHHDRGHNVPDPGPQTLLDLEFAEASSARPAALPDSWGTIAPLPVTNETASRLFVLSEEEEGLPEPRFFINGERFPDITPVLATADQLEIWEVRNDAEMDHPFHLHGMFFQVLDIGGVPAPHLGWKDTVNVPRQQTLRFAVRYDAPGRWMYHCHILEHAERGMMGELSVAASE